MESPSLSYSSTAPSRCATLAIFGDRPALRQQLREDAAMAGYSITAAAGLRELAEMDVPALPSVVLVDCPNPDAASIAALARLDLAASRQSTLLIVATTLDGLEDVFGAMDRSFPQLIADAEPADLALALGRALALTPRSGVRELGDADRQHLLRLSDEVSQLARKLEQLEAPRALVEDRLQSPAIAFRGAGQDTEAGLVRRPAPLPAPHLIRTILRQRQQRARFFEPDLFADPAWDILLDLAAAHGEGRRVSVTSLCIAAGVPPTTALRWITQMTQSGLLDRVEDRDDRRRAFIALSGKAVEALSAYFASIGAIASPL